MLYFRFLKRIPRWVVNPTCSCNLSCSHIARRQVDSLFKRCSSPTTPPEDKKILKIAIIGVPNSGKSTIINQLCGRSIFAASKKVHTTRCNARAVMVVQNTQIVFLDTPGLVTMEESRKHRLEAKCLLDSEEAVTEADVVGVIHDASNRYTQFELDRKILRILLLYPDKHQFLILNKIDIMKSKRDLLDCVKHLTEGSGPLEELNRTHPSDLFPLTDNGKNNISESELARLTENQTGWPLFKQVFMVSALTGNGVGDIQLYLMSIAKSGKWLYDGSILTDQSDEEIIERTTFAKFLDHLPNAVPYNINIQLEYFNKKTDGLVTTVILVIVKKEKIKKLIIGSGGQRIKNIAADVEQCLRTFYLNDVHVKLVLLVKENYSRSLETQEITEIPAEGVYS